jgi:DNA-binding CsgD family transcriptional regulator
VERNITPLESNQQLHNQLNEIHKDFMYNLHEKFPDLTTMELKIAALLSMKLTSSNIAAALFLSKRTVESHRLSLRKKCSIGKDDNIYEELSKYMV